MRKDHFRPDFLMIGQFFYCFSLHILSKQHIWTPVVIFYSDLVVSCLCVSGLIQVVCNNSSFSKLLTVCFYTHIVQGLIIQPHLDFLIQQDFVRGPTDQFVYTSMVSLGSVQQQFQVKLNQVADREEPFISCICSPDCLMICEWCFPQCS